MHTRTPLHSMDDKLERGEKLTSPKASVSNSNDREEAPYTNERLITLACCFLGLQVSYIVWGITQEQLMTQTYSFGRFTSAQFCVFGNRVLALITSLSIVLYNTYKQQIWATISPNSSNALIRNTAPIKTAPFYSYSPSSISNTLSSYAQYEALKYISFPTQVLSKSCKVIPVMIVGIFINKKRYPLSEYVDAFLITLGVSLFTLSEKLGGGSGNGEEKVDTMYGVVLLCMYLFCDSFTSQWQSRVYKQYGVDQYQMMLGKFWQIHHSSDGERRCCCWWWWW